MKKSIERMVIHTHDVMVMTGLSERSAIRLLTNIRKLNNKPPRSLVSIEDFCGYTKFKEEYVKTFLK